MLNVSKINLKEILYLRSLYLQENNFQIRYNACHERGWTDSYIVTFNHEKIGYGSIKGNENINDRDTIFEFYIIPSFRNLSLAAFLELLHSSKAAFIECQTNDLLLTSLLYQYGQNIHSDTVLLEENITTDIKMDNIVFRKRNETDVVFDHKAEPVGDYVLELNDEIVATGGFLLHYNLPFADLYMEVKEDCRRKGFGSFLIQELKKQCYLAGRVPAARTGTDNLASRATLIKAGCKIAGFMLLGKVKL
jgi:GNAT superfamily N-acetyltransferase